MISSIRTAPFKLVIFDCDGVLVDSEPISNRVLAEMLTEEGLPMTPAEARRDYHDKLIRDVRRTAEKKLGRALPEGWIAAFERNRAEAFVRGLRPIAGVAEVVQGVRAAGIAVCVASQGKLARTRLSLGLTGLRGLFDDDAMFSVDSVRRGKPYPDLFLHAAKCMGADAMDCVVLDDGPSGIKAAISAKMWAFGFAADTDAKRLQQAGAREVIRSLEELPDLLGI
jgi:HAD superfamily hydrolase (TIGR01509 family)